MQVGQNRGDEHLRWLSEQTDESRILRVERIQELWNGYGDLLRVFLDGPLSSVILKKVALPPNYQSSLSGRRKAKSYRVEETWYAQYAELCDENCRVARCLGVHRQDKEVLLLLEDLGTAGFSPHPHPGERETSAGLRWLAHFHSRFLRYETPGLWEQGCYWHFETRPEEWARMPSGTLKDRASQLDQALRQAKFQTLVHGDAKTSNFCWDHSGKASAVDFQYVGRGPGIRDVALFLARSLGHAGCLEEESRWLESYFRHLREALEHDQKSHLFDELRAEWEKLYPVAWSDYFRFRQGWAGPCQPDPYTALQLERAWRVLGDV